MKTKHFFKPLLLLFLSATLLTSCSSSDDGPVGGDVANLYNKWFYDSEDYTADMRFNSDGTYIQYIDYMGVNITNTGTWSWTNESQKIMRVTYETGPNAVTEAWFKFSDITEHGYKIKQSLDGTEFTNEMRTYNDAD